MKPRTDGSTPRRRATIAAMQSAAVARHDEHPVRLVVGEPSYVTSRGLVSIIGRTPGLELICRCNDVPQLLDRARTDVPDLILTDANFPGWEPGPAELPHALTAASPDSAIILWMDMVHVGAVRALLDCGVKRRGYLLKPTIRKPADLIETLLAVAAGQSRIGADILEEVVKDGRPTVTSELTAREHDVLAELAAGKSNQAIADSLALTKHGVERHINNIYRKLGVARSPTISPRVTAALLFSSSQADQAQPTPLAQSTTSDAPVRSPGIDSTRTHDIQGRIPTTEVHEIPADAAYGDSPLATS